MSDKDLKIKEMKLDVTEPKIDEPAAVATFGPPPEDHEITQTRREQLGVLAHHSGTAQREEIGIKTITETWIEDGESKSRQVAGTEWLVIEPDNSEHIDWIAN